MTLLRRLWHLLNRRRYERQLVAEMREHRGRMHDPAKFGDTHRLLEQSRDAWGWNWLDDASQDLRLGLRGLVRAPVYGTVDVIGREFPRSKPVATIVGVAGDAHSIKVESIYTAEVYRPLAAEEHVGAILIARARGDAAALAPVLREAAIIDPRILPGITLLSDSFERRVMGTRVASGVAVSTGLLTLVIACLGIFGVVSYGATLRIKEFGIHLALGAESRAVVRLVVRHIIWPVAIGMTLGVLAAGPIGVAMISSPIQVRVADPAAYGVALALFVLAAFVAAMLPAIRVLRSDPIQSLRHS